ncbi:uncharacterized protein LOC124258565 isoform X6 [Haliotis rubra]|uniref:uncharacterized protein LOC124258565 isoform X6 n=1 Tax=Haliotis rubra TaxID=36100 RepID=UPI001EE55835|nr:uncharacterized protein LOC124258565 isoform X6 [Haliotis rubra]
MSSRIQAQGYGHDFISSDDILVVPNFRTNEDLKNAICNRLNSKIMTKTVTERQPLPISKHPRLIVFRPSGRAGDEFQDNVTPHLTDPDAARHTDCLFRPRAVLVPFGHFHNDPVSTTEEMLLASGTLYQRRVDLSMGLFCMVLALNEEPS